VTLTARLGGCHLIFPPAYGLFAGRNSGTLADPEASRTGCRMAGRGRNRAAQREQYQSPQAQMSRVSRAGVLAAYRDGVTVICELAAQFSDATWLAATPCGEWRAVDLAGHLRCVADDYHEYLDDAPGSRLARLMAANAPADSLVRKLARQNAAELAALPDAPGPEHIMAFADSARAYGRRLPQSWDLIHHSYREIDVTVGAMAGAACAEWHLHAWDLARSLGKDYRPADPGLVLAAWRGGMPQLWPELTGWDGDDPWDYLLLASSRDPGWVQM